MTIINKNYLNISNLGSFVIKWVVFLLLILTATGCSSPVTKDTTRTKDLIVQTEDNVSHKVFRNDYIKVSSMTVTVIDSEGDTVDGVVVAIYFRVDTVMNGIITDVKGYLTDIKMSGEDGKFNTKINMPTSSKSVFLKTSYTGKRLYEVPINSSKFDYTLRI